MIKIGKFLVMVTSFGLCVNNAAAGNLQWTLEQSNYASQVVLYDSHDFGILAECGEEDFYSVKLIVDRVLFDFGPDNEGLSKGMKGANIVVDGNLELSRNAYRNENMGQLAVFEIVLDQEMIELFSAARSSIGIGLTSQRTGNLQFIAVADATGSTASIEKLIEYCEGE